MAKAKAIPDITIQSPEMMDVQTVLAFIQRQDIAAFGEVDVDLEDLQHEWRQISLSEDAWKILSHKGDLMGYAAVLPWGSDLRFDFYAEHTQPDLDIIRLLVALCEIRAAELAANREDHKVQAKAFIDHADNREREVLLESGFSSGQFIFQMQIQLGYRSIPEPILPPGVRIRTAIDGQDDREIHSLIQTAFAKPGREDTSFKDWKIHLMQPEIYDPNLWFLAVENEQIIGASLSFEYPALGWIRQLGVDPSRQRQGIGIALLQRTFQAFQSRQKSIAGLTVESERPDAYEFYQRVGMTPVRRYDEYTKTIFPEK